MTQIQPNSPTRCLILTTKIITANPRTGLLEKPIENHAIEVSVPNGRILCVRPSNEEDFAMMNAEGSNSIRVIDLRGKTVLPGFIDTHVHFFLHPYKETSWEDQVTRESTAERTIRAVTHAKATLLAGYTTVRDLGTEGAEDADMALRKCLSGETRIIPGPRYLCASRAIVATGSYGPKNQQRPYITEVDGKAGADSASGVDECVRTVRRHIGAGADWIKIYADYPARILDTTTRIGSKSLPLFSSEEVKAMVETAHRQGVKVAAHCVNPTTIKMLIENGVNTLEHATEITEELLPLLLEKGVAWSPTFAAYYSHTYPGSRKWDAIGKVYRKAVEMGVLVATGGDTGVFPHGDNSLEMRLMYRLGTNWKDLIRAVTWNSWLCVRGLYWESEEGKAELMSYEGPSLLWAEKEMQDNDVPVGCISPGFAADIIATDGDLENDFENAVSQAAISFVMKAGTVYKQNGTSCC